MANHHIYDHTAPTLHAAGYQTLRFDLVGHNRTPPPTDPTRNKPGAFHFDDFCQHINIIRQNVRGDRKWSHPAAIIGCSVGGVLAVRYHMLYPPPAGKTTRILSMAAPGMSTLPASPGKWKARIQKWKDDGSVADLAAQTLERWFPEPRLAYLDINRARGILESCSLDGYEICAWATMNFDFTGQLEGIKDGKNVMILGGDEDVNIGPREVLVDMSRIRGSRYVLLEGVGHIPPMHPNVFEPVMLKFLGTTDALVDE